MSCPVCHGNPNYQPMSTYRAICWTVIAMGAIFLILWAVYEVTG